MTAQDAPAREALKPCPFCGGEAALWEAVHGDEGVEVRIDCVKCHATIYERTDLEALAAWNARAEQEATANELASVARAGYEAWTAPGFPAVEFADALRELGLRIVRSGT
jgi:Lar family restriction alleviation protein